MSHSAQSSEASRVHEYALRPDGAGWVLTRDGRPIGGFPTYDQALSIALRITGDLCRGGVNVELVGGARPGRA